MKATNYTFRYQSVPLRKIILEWKEKKNFLIIYTLRQHWEFKKIYITSISTQRQRKKMTQVLRELTQEIFHFFKIFTILYQNGENNYSSRKNWHSWKKNQNMYFPRNFFELQKFLFFQEINYATFSVFSTQTHFSTWTQSICIRLIFPLGQCCNTRSQLKLF